MAMNNPLMASFFKKPLRPASKIGRLLFSSNSTKKWPKRIFSGIQPTGVLHLGNYFGAVENWIKLQDENTDVMFSIVDLHSITIPKDKKELSSGILNMTATLLGCGIDPSRTTLFLQSKVPEHGALSWVLGTMVSMTRLYHFPQYKEKSATFKDVPLGLFLYPVLQAADILLYKSTDIPVGDDQIQHVHMTQHLVNYFNNKYGETFPFPKYIVKSDNGASRIRSLREPEKKMSKSHLDPKSRIEITDSPDEILMKIKKAVTDCCSEVKYDPENRPGVSNLIALHSLAVGSTPEDICKSNAHLDTGRYKLVVAEALIERFNPLREEILRLQNSPEYLEQVLDDGARRASEIAACTWSEVCLKMGLYRNVSNSAECLQSSN